MLSVVIITVGVALIVLSPVIGFFLGQVIKVITLHLFKRTTPRRVDPLFRVLLYGTKMTGPDFYVPFWVIIASYSAIPLGTLAGGWRVIRNLGVGLTDLKSAPPIPSPAPSWASAQQNGCPPSAGIWRRISSGPGYSPFPAP